MYELPQDYNMDYVVYSVASSISEQAKVWDMDHYEVMKTLMFKKFDGWLERESMNKE